MTPALGVPRNGGETSIGCALSASQSARYERRQSAQWHHEKIPLRTVPLAASPSTTNYRSRHHLPRGLFRPDTRARERLHRLREPTARPVRSPARLLGRLRLEWRRMEPALWLGHGVGFDKPARLRSLRHRQRQKAERRQIPGYRTPRNPCLRSDRTHTPVRCAVRLPACSTFASSSATAPSSCARGRPGLASSCRPASPRATNRFFQCVIAGDVTLHRKRSWLV